MILLLGALRWALRRALRRPPRKWLAPLADLGGFAPSGAPTPCRHSISHRVIIYGLVTVTNNYTKNAGSAPGAKPLIGHRAELAWWAAQRPKNTRTQTSTPSTNPYNSN